MWTPDPITPLHNTSETAPINVSIRFIPPDPFDPEPISYAGTWLSGATPPNVTLTPAVGPPRLVVAGPNLIGLAPVSILFLLPDMSFDTVNLWSALPEEATQIIRYLAPPANSVSAQFNVRATYLGGSFIDQVYTVVATIDYTSGRDSLVQAVNERR